MILIELNPGRWVNPDDVSSLYGTLDGTSTDLRFRHDRVINVPMPVEEVAALINRSPMPDGVR